MSTVLKKIGKSAFFTALIFSVSLFFFGEFSAKAFDYPELTLNQTVKGKMSDYWNAVNYSVNINNDCDIKIVYNGTVKSEISLRNQNFKEIYNVKNRKKINDNIHLKKGEYLLSIYNCTYREGEYSIRLSTTLKYTDSISFTALKFYLSVGEEFSPTIKKTPINSVIKEIVWSSGSPARASIDQNGKITAKSLGKTVVKATLNNGKTAKTSIFVNEKSYTLKQGEKKILPRINGKKVKWKSSNSSVVKLTKKKLKAKAVGTAVLTKTVGKTKYTVNITVEK